MFVRISAEQSISNHIVFHRGKTILATRYPLVYMLDGLSDRNGQDEV